MPASSSGRTTAATAHQAVIADQFTRQAAQFAASPSLHNQAALDLLVDAASPRADDVSLDVACGPGSVVCAFARRVRRAVGLDATEAMLDEARRLAAASGVDNVGVALRRRVRAAVRRRRFRRRQLPFCLASPAAAGLSLRRNAARLPPRRPRRPMRRRGVGRCSQGRRLQRHGAPPRPLHRRVPPARLLLALFRDAGLPSPPPASTRSPPSATASSPPPSPPTPTAPSCAP